MKESGNQEIPKSSLFCATLWQLIFSLIKIVFMAPGYYKGLKWNIFRSFSSFTRTDKTWWLCRALGLAFVWKLCDASKAASSPLPEPPPTPLTAAALQRHEESFRAWQVQQDHVSRVWRFNVSLFDEQNMFQASMGLWSECGRLSCNNRPLILPRMQWRNSAENGFSMLQSF